MASNQTQHYQLSQWEAGDKVERLDFNADNEKIDAALHGLAQETAAKAENAAVSSLAAKVDSKADQSALNALGQAHTNDVAALRSENCWVKLSDETLGVAASGYSWTITNPQDYTELQCIFTLACSGKISLSIQDGATLMEVDSGLGTATINNCLMLGGAIPHAGGQIRLSPMGGDGNVLIHYEISGIAEDRRFYCPNRYLASAEQTYSGLSTVKIFSDDGTFSAGSRFLLYGLKK